MRDDNSVDDDDKPTMMKMYVEKGGGGTPYQQLIFVYLTSTHLNPVTKSEEAP